HDRGREAGGGVSLEQTALAFRLVAAIAPVRVAQRRGVLAHDVVARRGLVRAGRRDEHVLVGDVLERLDVSAHVIWRERDPLDYGVVPAVGRNVFSEGRAQRWHIVNVGGDVVRAV